MNTTLFYHIINDNMNDNMKDNIKYKMKDIQYHINDVMYSLYEPLNITFPENIKYIYSNNDNILSLFAKSCLIIFFYIIFYVSINGFCIYILYRYILQNIFKNLPNISYQQMCLIVMTIFLYIIIY